MEFQVVIPVLISFAISVADQRFLHLSLPSIKYPAPIQILQNRNLSFVRYQKYLLQS